MRVCQTRRFHSICLHFVLIATAIQGVTPDAHDLASLNALRVFCPPLSSSGAVPQDDGLPDTDDVCGSTTIETEQVFRANADLNALVTRAHAAGETHATTTSSKAYRSLTDGGDTTATDDLLRCLCRLNC